MNSPESKSLPAAPAASAPSAASAAGGAPGSLGNLLSAANAAGAANAVGAANAANAGKGDSKISASQIITGGMPCKFELVMEFFSTFIFTFIIYFCVFYFIPYDEIVEEILDFIETTTKKFVDFLYTLIPKPVKKAASRLFPKFIVKFFKETLPNLLNKKKEEATTSLKKKLQKIKDDVDKKINNQRKKAKNNKNFLSELSLYLNEKYSLTKAKIITLWEKFKDKIVPAIVISFIYYIIWVIFFKLIPTILKYLINVAQKFKQP